MSWSVSGQTDQQGVADFMSAKREEALQQNSECGDQFDAVTEAVITLINSGSVGDASRRFSMTLTGHANPNHEPRDGWANDAVTISLYQV